MIGECYESADIEPDILELASHNSICGLLGYNRPARHSSWVGS